METVVNTVLNLLGTVVRVVLWAVTAVLALGLLAVAVVVLIVGVLWAVLRGRKPAAPLVVGKFTAYGKQRIWPGTAEARSPKSDDVVDVQARDVDAPALPTKPSDGPVG